ncbi:hypothetical protein GCM10020256_49610 [Streptomyces thermocoprophilus]
MVTMPIPGTPSRAELVDHLVRTRIAGDVATPRENNLLHYRKLANGDRRYWFGLELGDRWSDEQDVLAVMAERVGVNDDPEHRHGQDTIDPELTLSALERMAARLRKAADGRQRVLLATGHPGGLLDVHRATAQALRAAGCEIVVIPDGLVTDEGYVMQFADVAVLEHGATLWHTHSGEPMRAILTGLERAGRPLPDLVVADHGWAGVRGAARRGRGRVRRLQRPGTVPRGVRGHPSGGGAARRPCGEPSPLRPDDGVSAGGGGAGLSPGRRRAARRPSARCRTVRAAAVRPFSRPYRASCPTRTPGRPRPAGPTGLARPSG